MSDVAIRSERLVKTYGRVRALDELDLEVASGEIYGFLGPNGAGKTTTIRLLVDLIRPDSGCVEVLGMDPRAQGVEVRRRVGYLAGDFVVDGRQTARELLTYIANVRGVGPARIAALIERLDLDPTPRIKTLSRGNRQKVGVIQAFMHDPELLILDEPTSGLDPGYERSLMELLADLADAGRTVIVVTHSVQSLHLCDRILCLAPGDAVTHRSPNYVASFAASAETAIREVVDADAILGNRWFLATMHNHDRIGVPLPTLQRIPENRHRARRCSHLLFLPTIGRGAGGPECQADGHHPL